MFARRVRGAGLHLSASRGGVWPYLAAGCAVFALCGCERSGIEQHEVAKGVERVPAEPERVPGSGRASGRPASGADRVWAVPAGWTEDPEPRRMRLATYIAEGPRGPVEVAVTRFAGRVGGALANINRWRGQMGLPSIGESELDEAIVRFSAPGYDGYEARIESSRGVMLAAGVYERATDQMWFVRAEVPEAEAADRLQAELFGVARSIAGDGGGG